MFGVFWFLCAFFVGAHAHRNGWSAWKWFALSLFLSPVIAFSIIHAKTGDVKQE